MPSHILAAPVCLHGLTCTWRAFDLSYQLIWFKDLFYLSSLYPPQLFITHSYGFSFDYRVQLFLQSALSLVFYHHILAWSLVSPNEGNSSILGTDVSRATFRAVIRASPYAKLVDSTSLKSIAQYYAKAVIEAVFSSTSQRLLNGSICIERCTSM